MNDGPRRRRRLDEPSGNGGGGLPLIPLIIVVVLAGLLIGGILAKVLGSKSATPAATPLPAVTVSALPTETPIPIPSVSPSTTAKASPSPKASPTAKSSTAPTTSPSPTAVASATASPTAAPTEKTTPKATEKPAIVPAVVKTPKPATPKPAVVRPATPKPTATPIPPPPSAGDRATQVVRLYLDALARGDTNEARSYLASGNASETFMNRSAHLNFVRPTSNGNGTWLVNADVTTDSGEYFFTFTVTVAPGGAVITDHTAIKPQ